MGKFRAIFEDKELILICIIRFIAEAKLIHTFSSFCHIVINPGWFIDTVFYLRFPFVISLAINQPNKVDYSSEFHIYLKYWDRHT